MLNFVFVFLLLVYFQYFPFLHLTKTVAGQTGKRGAQKNASADVLHHRFGRRVQLVGVVETVLEYLLFPYDPYGFYFKRGNRPFPRALR